MKTEYDLSKMQSRKNPYASKLKKQGSTRPAEDVVVKVDVSWPSKPA